MATAPNQDVQHSIEQDSDEFGSAGTSVYGNFHQYYRFNPVEERLQHLSPELLICLKQSADAAKQCISLLDIGCNEGALTLALVQRIRERATTAPVAAVGVDIDPVLIQRAVKKQVLGISIGQTIEADSKKAPLTDSDSRTQAVFLCGDFTTALTQQAIAKQLSAFACKTGDRFSLVTCFSVTMWIHLHHGEEGLCQFLRDVSSRCENLLIEPQPWKCYKTCRLRWKRADNPRPLPRPWESYKWRNDVDDRIVAYLQDVCGMQLQKPLGQTQWGRSIVWLKARAGDTIPEVNNTAPGAVAVVL